jgi:hypothetical protein
MSRNIALRQQAIEILAQIEPEAPPPLPVYRLRIAGPFISTGVGKPLEATMARMFSAPHIVGIHVETPMMQVDLAADAALYDSCARNGRFVWRDITWKAFGSSAGICPPGLTPFQHKPNAWMLPIHEEAGIEALCAFTERYRREFDGHPAFAYFCGSETATGPIAYVPKAMYPALTSGWLRYIDELGLFQRAQPLLYLNFFHDLLALKTRAAEKRVSQAAVDAVDLKDSAAFDSPLQPFVACATPHALGKLGVDGVKQWCRDPSHYAIASAWEDNLAAPNDWKTIVNALR